MEKQRKNTRRNRGITLIALVITIIILLILAGISIAQLTGTGIFAKAKEAKAKYKNAEELENQTLAEYERIMNELGSSSTPIEEEEIGEEEIITNLNIAKRPKTYFGLEVTGYECEKSDACTWRIFYADDNNIYLIADSVIERKDVPTGKNGSVVGEEKSSTIGKHDCNLDEIEKNYNGSSDITDERIKALNNDYFNVKKFSSTKSNMKRVAYMLDIEAWKGYQGNCAEYAIGVPTAELFIKSYNKKYDTNYKVEAIDDCGYKISKDDGKTWNVSVNFDYDDELYQGNGHTTDCAESFLASPHAYSDTGTMGICVADGRGKRRIF